MRYKPLMQADYERHPVPTALGILAALALVNVAATVFSLFAETAGPLFR